MLAATRLGRAAVDRARVNWRQPAEPLRFGERRKRHEMHHDAGCKPHREEQAERDAQPAMQQDERARHAVRFLLRT